MTRRTSYSTKRGTMFRGTLARGYPGPFEINGRRVGRAEFRRVYSRRMLKHEVPRVPIRVVAAPRGRKRALDGRRQWRGCEHEFEYHEGTIGDYGVVNGTYTERWLECACCGEQRSATYADAPSDDYFDDF